MHDKDYDDDFLKQYPSLEPSEPLPALVRYFVRSPLTAETVAVVEAVDATQAQSRALAMVHPTRMQLQLLHTAIKTYEHVALEPVEPGDVIRVPIFTEQFFEQMDAKDSLKH